ncbi:MAG: CPBP family intramembrane metalloprotease [Acidobacteria bacterium]|nr:CPBP family intramembrane metalloprotease [Acidobacteriota bacterium]
MPAEGEASSRRRFPPWADCILWLVAGWLAIFTASILVLAILRALPPSHSLESFLSFVPNLLGISLVLALGLYASPSPGVQVLSVRRPPWRVLPAVALSTLGLTLLAAELDTYLEELLPPPDWVLEIFRRVLDYHTALEFFGVVSFLVVIAPLTEELLFRGLFLHRLAEGYGTRAGVLGSALCFGVFHILPWQVVGATLVGIYLGWLVVKTRSVFVPMFAHALFNLVPVVATGLASRSAILRQLAAEVPAADSHLPPHWLLLSTLAFASGVLWIRRISSPSAGAPNS